MSNANAILDTKRMAERRLDTLGYPMALESVNYDPTDDLYLRVNFVVRTPEDPVIGDRYYRERITLQVYVADQLDIGTAGALAVAGEVRDLFDKGQTFVENSTNIYVLGTPRIAGSAITKDRLIIPVLIELVAEVFE